MVSRVKLPQPGSGKARVCDITAGSGRAGPSVDCGRDGRLVAIGGAGCSGVRSASAGCRSEQVFDPVGVVVPSAVPDAAALPRRVRTPDLSLSRSLRRAASASTRELPGSRQASRQAPPGSRQASRQAPASREASQALCSSPMDTAELDADQLPLGEIVGQMDARQMSASASALAASLKNSSALAASLKNSLKNPLSSIGDGRSVQSLASPSKPLDGSACSFVDSNMQGDEAVDAVDDGITAAALPSHDPPPVELPPRTPQRQGSRERAPRQGSRQRSRQHSRQRQGQAPGLDEAAPPAAQRGSSAAPARRRSQSEPAQRSKTKERLPQLIDEVSSHLHSMDRAQDPSDTKGWLEQTAQLELFIEEMSWLLDAQDSRQDKAMPSRIEEDYDDEEFARGRNARKHREASVLRGDKDLRWARQQLRTLEKEHTHLSHLLSISDPAVQQDQVTELRNLEQDIVAEQKRQKMVAAENRRREKSLARMVGDNAEGDGTARALQQIDRLESELAVLKVKNTSLQKQVEEATAKLQRACEHRMQVDAKKQQVAARMGREDMQTRLAEQRAQEEQRQDEEASLRRELAELQEARKRATRCHERTMKEKARELVEFKEQHAELDLKKTKMEAEERMLLRHLRQQQPHKRLPSSHGQSPHGARSAASPGPSPRPSPARRPSRGPADSTNEASAVSGAASRRPPRPKPLQESPVNSNNSVGALPAARDDGSNPRALSPSERVAGAAAASDIADTTLSNDAGAEANAESSSSHSQEKTQMHDSPVCEEQVPVQAIEAPTNDISDCHLPDATEPQSTDDEVTLEASAHDESMSASPANADLPDCEKVPWKESLACDVESQDFADEAPIADVNDVESTGMSPAARASAVPESPDASRPGSSGQGSGASGSRAMSRGSSPDQA
eukprot:TRINITY_DN753_c0_g4_i1.p1 TRINITY_DN753_c0_g4~~TRINITY_DN753_c0_g4_i1.p1  ORF type:complete len:988 (-),score=156.58 TRINITY_DN753_c0_g4_i1:150-2873(-)